MNSTHDEKTLTTADVADAVARPVRQEMPEERASQRQEMADDRDRMPQDRVDSGEHADRLLDVRESRSGRAMNDRADPEHLEALFAPDVAGDFRQRWDAVQIGFVDDPGLAVQQADELVAQVIKSLAETFAQERARFESQTDGSEESTENMRVTLRRYRSFFDRLLTL